MAFDIQTRANDELRRALRISESLVDVHSLMRDSKSLRLLQLFRWHSGSNRASTFSEWARRIVIYKRRPSGPTQWMDPHQS